MWLKYGLLLLLSLIRAILPLHPQVHAFMFLAQTLVGG